MKDAIQNQCTYCGQIDCKKIWHYSFANVPPKFIVVMYMVGFLLMMVLAYCSVR